MFVVRVLGSLGRTNISLSGVSYKGNRKRNESQSVLDKSYVCFGKLAGSLQLGERAKFKL